MLRGSSAVTHHRIGMSADAARKSACATLNINFINILYAVTYKELLSLLGSVC
jgi:hypothetical protein